jgi:glycerol-3-phosphate acyltransferase PlsX
MGESGPMAVRRKRDASLSVAMRLLAGGKVDAVVSAGNSSAIVATASHYVGSMAGIRRPSLAVPLPTLRGSALLVDAGAYAEASSIHLAHSAALAHAYLQVTGGIEQPRLGLLNIGIEAAKGPRFVRRVHALLKRSHFHFAGNIEPREILDGRVDAVICNGFVGNIVLKFYEAATESLLDSVGETFDALAPHHGAEPRLHLDRLRHRFAYQNTGGAPLLGLCKPVVVAHGRSDETALVNAIRLAQEFVERRVHEHMAESLESSSMVAEWRRSCRLLTLNQLTSRWGFSHHQN